MKIVLISHHFPPHYRAGGEQYAYRVAQGLRCQGHTVEVVCIESIADGTLTPCCTTETYEGLVAHRLHFDVRQAPNRFEWSFRNPELGHWVENFLRNACPDVVHINSGYLLGGAVPEAAFRLGIPTVLTLHEYWFLCPLLILLRPDGSICDEPVPVARCVWCSLSEKRRYRLPDSQLNGLLGDAFVRLSQSKWMAKVMGVVPHLEIIAERRAYLKQVLEAIDLVISPSRFLIQKVEEYGFRPRHMVCLPFGLDKTHISHPGLHSPSEKLRIGYLGQFAPHKGVHLLLAAFKRLVKRSPSYELILHGRLSTDSAYERKLRRMAQDQPSITFAGPYPNEQVGQILNGLDVLVVPSIWYENRPTAIIEAHAAQVPVVAARLGGMRELIKHDENGLLFEVGSVESLAEQLGRLVAEPGLLPHLRSGIGPVPAVEDEIATLVSLYEFLLSAPPKAAPTRPETRVPPNGY